MVFSNQHLCFLQPKTYINLPHGISKDVSLCIALVPLHWKQLVRNWKSSDSALNFANYNYRLKKTLQSSYKYDHYYSWRKSWFCTIIIRMRWNSLLNNSVAMSFKYLHYLFPIYINIQFCVITFSTYIS